MRQTLSVVLLLICCVSLASAQTFKIDKIEFEGLKRHAANDIITIAALKQGDTFSVDALDAAAQRLIDSGYFTKVAYRTKGTKDLIAITFVVEEAKLNLSPVVFDNFIWFSDTDLQIAIQRDLPTFTGTVPDTGDSTEKIIKALQRFLHENKIEATVSHMASESGGRMSQVFSVTGIPMPICSIHFPGIEKIPEAKLLEHSQSLRGTDYSAQFVTAFAERSLIAIYQEAGMLKAKFAPAQGKPEESATCKSGVDVTIPIYEGEVYSFEKAEWIGNQSLTPQELDPTIGVKPGEVANAIKIAEADRLIRRAYGRKGFLDVLIKRTPQLSDESRKAVFKFQITEGRQYKMGQLIAKGFDENETKQLLQKWGLKPGAVFDNEYLQEFLKANLVEILRERLIAGQTQGKSPPKPKSDYKVNRETLTVDVILELTN